MNYLLIRNLGIAFLMLVSVTACTTWRSSLSSIDWLPGGWESKAGSSMIVEEWQQSSSKEWTGRGMLVKEGDTTVFEKLKITRKEKNYYYVADILENSESTWFKIIEINDSSFTCINPEHDFPKKIVYLRNGDRLSVVISGDGKEREFNFLRKGSGSSL
ncbi:MAG: DUF6265 family protein [Bacteroidia bacterium]